MKKKIQKCSPVSNSKKKKKEMISFDVFASRLATWGENDDLFDIRL